MLTAWRAGDADPGAGRGAVRRGAHGPGGPWRAGPACGAGRAPLATAGARARGCGMGGLGWGLWWRGGAWDADGGGARAEEDAGDKPRAWERQ
jgi:hypothetical protein